MSSLIPFSFESEPVRVLERDGEPWFVLADICKVLEVGNPSQAATRLDDDEKYTLISNEGIASAQVQQLIIINESGLYSLILTSRKPAAKRFKRWVTAEVIPSIRKTGSYGVSNAALLEAVNTRFNIPQTKAGALRLAADLSDRVEVLEEKVEELSPKAEALNRIAEADGSLCMTDAAKTLQVRPRDLFGYLSLHRWIYKRAGCGHFCAYQERIVSGDLEHKVTTVLRGDGSEKVTEQVRVTPRGLTRLAKLLPAVRVVA